MVMHLSDNAFLWWLRSLPRDPTLVSELQIVVCYVGKLSIMSCVNKTLEGLRWAKKKLLIDEISQSRSFRSFHRSHHTPFALEWFTLRWDESNYEMFETKIFLKDFRIKKTGNSISNKLKYFPGRLPHRRISFKLALKALSKHRQRGRCWRSKRISISAASFIHPQCCCCFYAFAVIPPPTLISSHLRTSP